MKFKLYLIFSYKSFILFELNVYFIFTAIFSSAISFSVIVLNKKTVGFLLLLQSLRTSYAFLMLSETNSHGFFNYLFFLYLLFLPVIHAYAVSPSII